MHRVLICLLGGDLIGDEKNLIASAACVCVCYTEPSRTLVVCHALTRTGGKALAVANTADVLHHGEG
jgi:hypothetical protein